MKQIRMIRISFFICAMCAVIAFWSGFYFGENYQTKDPTLTASQTQDPQKITARESESETSGSTGGEEPYYLKSSGDYLSVYYGADREFYFETDVRLSDLPQTLQETAEESGISFSSLEDVYSFLENYSS